MKHSAKKLILLCTTLLCILMFSTMAMAATTPAQVKNVKAAAAESSVKLSWKKTSSATGYYIYRLDADSNTLTRIGKVKASVSTVTIKKLKNATTYSFCVSAYRTVKSKTYEGTKSKTVTATPNVTKPAVPKLMISSCGNGYIKLSWNAVPKASGYKVYQLDETSGEYVSIGTTKKTAVTIKKLTNGTNYKFKIRAYRKVSGITRDGNFSTVVNGKPVNITSKDMSSIQSMGFKATVTATIKAQLKSNPKKTVSVSAGTKVTVTVRSNGSSTVKLPNGKIVLINNGYLSWNSCIYDSKTDYSTSLKENYVNAKGYASTSKYLVWISLYRQRLYIFKGSQCNWTLFKSYKCATGVAKTSTPKGRYTLHRKAPTFRFDEDCFGYYASFFSGNAIHSWVYTNAGNRYNDGSVGAPASHGCVRVEKPQALYIYNLLPIGTTIIIY